MDKQDMFILLEEGLKFEFCKTEQQKRKKKCSHGFSLWTGSVFLREAIVADPSVVDFSPALTIFPAVKLEQLRVQANIVGVNSLETLSCA